MPQLSVRLSSFLALALLAAGCAVQPGTDEADADLGASIESELTSSNATFYVVTRNDFRRCRSPICGGFYVKRVNAELDANGDRRGMTRCFDGTWQADCYVSDADLGRVFGGSTDEGRIAFAAKLENGEALVRATFAANAGADSSVPRLRVSEAWIAGSDARVPASARFGRVTQPMIKCRAGAVCPSFLHTKLNVSGSQVGFKTLRFAAAVGADAESEARAALVDEGAEGILTAGNVPSGNASKHNVQQYYRRVKGDPCGGHRVVPMTCAEGFFCSYELRDICGFADAGGTCAPKPEACNLRVDQVCGCDGQTYGNACTAASAGVSVQSHGACAN